MKKAYPYLIRCALILSVSGCSKTEQNTPVQSTQSQPAAPVPAAAPKAVELTKDVLVDAFKRSSINSLPVFLKIADAQFEVVNAVDATRVIKGTVTLEVLEDTFKKSRALQFQTPSTTYRIQLLNAVKKKGNQISLPFSDRIDLAAAHPTIQLPALEDYGSEAAKYPHSFVEGSEKAMKAESLIDDALTASKKADIMQNKWHNLNRLKDGIADLDSFRSFMNNGGWSTITPCFDDQNYSDTLFQKVANRLNGNLAAQYDAFISSVKPLLDKEYPRVEKIINDAKEKSQVCSDYLLNL
jgi:hypothetical protein